MENKKPEGYLWRKLIFLLIVFMPLGQLPSVVLNFIIKTPFRIQPLDILSLFSLLLGFRLLFLNTSWVKRIRDFLFVLIVSLVLSSVMFGFVDLLGVFYLARTVGYLIIPIGVYQFTSLKDKRSLIDALLMTAVVVGLLGWLQYFISPDLRSLKAIGWDDHYFRLVSTFFDPAFTGFIFVLGVITALVRYLEKRSSLSVMLMVFFLLSLGFTYSRASFIALFVALIAAFFYYRRRIVLLVIGALAGLILLLPRPGGSGVELERVHSIVLKLENYQDSLRIIEYSPIFGVGYNNICLVKAKLLQTGFAESHSCYGLDNSFLFILATTGVVGLSSFLYLIGVLLRSSARNIYGTTLVLSGIALFAHTLFTNTLFYPVFLVWFGILVGVSRKAKE